MICAGTTYLVIALEWYSELHYHLMKYFPFLWEGQVGLLNEQFFLLKN